jgi:Predicted Fe-S oxidoreductases
MTNQPGTSKKLNSEEFRRIMESMKYRKKAENTKEDSVYLPLDMGLFLTGRCNLRCKHCFEWNEDGFLANGNSIYANGELSLEKIEECLEYTKPAKTRLYLWGGEPLAYSHFHELTEMLKKDPRWTTVCTNGLLIEKHLDDLIEISENLVLLISLDGLEESNDEIRGKGTFDKVIATVRKLIDLKKEGRFKGEVSVCSVINDSMIGRIYEYCEFMEEQDINTLYLSFPWYISPEAAAEMDVEVKKRFGDIIEIRNYKEASWHDFTFHIFPEKIEQLKYDLRKVSERKWNIRIRFQPAIEPSEIDDFVLGGTSAVQGRTKCLVPYNRIDILQSGEVSACKLFKEFSVGNLNEESIGDIWEGDRMKEMRKRMKCGLMPACSKCVLLYLNGE